MNADEAKALCLELIAADSEEDVVRLLEERGLWDDSKLWRYYGDDELNWNRAGNQQSRSDFAVNEKLVNTIDSRLMLECMLAGIHPEDTSAAPSTMREAVNRFIEKTWSGTLKVSGGRVEDWPTAFRTQIADGISVFVTGEKGAKPCVNVADLGEGQTPEAFPRTLLSLGKNNKIRVNFVQGKFGQGSTGAVRFCGKRKLQLIISKRHPELVGHPCVSPDYPVDATDDQWGFTVVRREGEGKIRSPFLSYLAPLDAGRPDHERRGRVLRFASDEMPLFPKGDNAYQRMVKHGTLVKLYEYNLKSTSNILRRDGLRPKIDLLLPEPALPMRFHECRASQKSGSEQTETMSGLFARLANSKNLEEVKPDTMALTVHGHELFARVFAFAPGSAKTYRNTEGVIFTINGQTQGYVKANLFARKRVGLQRLAKDLLVVLDCSSLSALEQDDMFMPSRDRLVEDNAFAMEIERKLEEALHEHQGLRDLRNRRAKSEMEEQLADNKPLEDVLKRVLKSSPNLARIFGQGLRLQNPFKPEHVKPADKPLPTKPHPTFFRFAGKEQGHELVRAAHIDNRVRLAFETDASDDYFTRKVDHGEKALQQLIAGEHVAMDYVGPNLVDGRANLTFQLPEGTKVGDSLNLRFIVRDPVTGSEFENRAKLAVLAAVDTPPGGKKKPKVKPDEVQGPDTQGNSGIDFPRVIWVEQKSPTWGNHFESTDDVVHILDEESDEAKKDTTSFQFYLNADNRSLKNEMAYSKASADVVKKQFEIGVVLFSMAMLYDEKQEAAKLEKSRPSDEPKTQEPEFTPEERAADMVRAVAPVIIPMIQGLGELAEDVADESDLVGEAA